MYNKPGRLKLRNLNIIYISEITRIFKIYEKNSSYILIKMSRIQNPESRIQNPDEHYKYLV